MTAAAFWVVVKLDEPKELGVILRQNSKVNLEAIDSTCTW